jgi:hypothetical protein
MDKILELKLKLIMIVGNEESIDTHFDVTEVSLEFLKWMPGYGNPSEEEIKAKTNFS